MQDKQKSQGPTDRRRANRRTDQHAMLVAEYHGYGLPAFEEFVHVETRDLSPAGMSFFFHRPIDSPYLILMMGELAKRPIVILARIRHSSEGFWERRRQFLVGCDFVKRLDIQVDAFTPAVPPEAFASSLVPDPA